MGKGNALENKEGVESVERGTSINRLWLKRNDYTWTEGLAFSSRGPWIKSSR